MKRKEIEKCTDLLNRERGITLIALVVTIVVLLILAGVSISLILDNNGIIKRSKDARREYGQAKENEQADLNKVSEWIEKQANGNGETTKPIKVAVNEKATSNGTINGEEGNSNNPTIPEGYTPIDTATSEWGDGSTAPTQDSVDHGLVIRDDSNNEWVWIPVPDVTVMCDTSNQTEYTLCGTEGETSVKTKLYSKSEIISGQTRTTPGATSDLREPDLVVESGGTSYDAKEEYYKDILGFESKEKMAEAFVADYNEMIASIGKYGGFYIGRYELSSEGIQKDKATLTNTNWYNLYNACRSSNLQASNKVKTQMIWGCQWDVACNFIANKGDKKSITNSRTWGNYSDSTENAAVTVTESGTTKKYGSKQNTGYSEYWKANNIYDLAGNCYEWTQEAALTGSRAIRGGCYDGSGSDFPASDRPGGSPDGSYDGHQRFSSHFNNKVTLER